LINTYIRLIILHKEFQLSENRGNFKTLLCKVKVPGFQFWPKLESLGQWHPTAVICIMLNEQPQKKMREKCHPLITTAQWIGTTGTPLFTTGTQLVTTGTPMVNTGLWPVLASGLSVITSVRII
jgi:hypothetical protein